VTDNEIRFLTIAEIEVDEAVSWYQKQSEDQDLDFLKLPTEAFATPNT
jgi:hypothetical protein